jgi:hypothetical protein
MAVKKGRGQLRHDCQHKRKKAVKAPQMIMLKADDGRGTAFGFRKKPFS